MCRWTGLRLFLRNGRTGTMESIVFDTCACKVKAHERMEKAANENCHEFHSHYFGAVLHPKRSTEWPCAHARRWFVLTPQYLCSFKNQGAGLSSVPAVGLISE